jgi:septal ring factor EnvC (AmiA/AmiB activator)
MQSSGSLKYLLQRVATEKISLAASVANSEADIETIKEQLASSLANISAVESEIEELRNNLLDAYRLRGLVQVSLSRSIFSVIAAHWAQSDEVRAKADRDRLALVVTVSRQAYSPPLTASRRGDESSQGSRVIRSSRVLW